jgi:uncharacterized Zn finger protein
VSDSAVWTSLWQSRLRAAGLEVALAAGRRWLAGGNLMLRVRFGAGRVRGQALQPGTGWTAEVALRTAVWPEKAWSRAAESLASPGAAAMAAAAVAAGGLPAGLEAVLRPHALSLVPEVAGWSCTCGARGVCEHLAALLVRVTDCVADDPQLLFWLRGRSPAAVRALVGASPCPGSEAGTGEGFWVFEPPVPPRVRTPGPSAGVDAAALRPVLGEDLAAVLERLHGAVRRAAADVLRSGGARP